MVSLEDQVYEAKLQNLRRHAPFLKGMIDKLRAQERTQQVSKLESLWSMITSNKRLKFETLQKCEDVMLKIQSKSHAGVNNSGQAQSGSFNKKSFVKTNQPNKHVVVIMNAVNLNIARAKLHNEVVAPTPKSPTPDRDLPQHIPIRIPMDKVDDIHEIASPDPDEDPAIIWSETNENRYDSARPDVYTNAVMHKPMKEKPFFEPPKPIMPPVNINTPPISMQDLQQLEDSIPVEKKKQDSDCKKEQSAEEKLLKRPSKVSLVPAPIIKPKHKKDGDKVSNGDKCKTKSDGSKKSHMEKDLSKSKPEESKFLANEHKAASKPIEKEKESKKPSESSSKHKSSKSSSHKSSHHSSDKPSIDKASSSKPSSHTTSKVKDCKSNPSKSPRRISADDQTSKTDTVFGSLLSSIDNTLLTERDASKKKVPTKSIETQLACKPSGTNNITGGQDKSTKPPVTEASSKLDEKTSEDKTVFKRLADKYNPRPKKKEPEITQPTRCIVSLRPQESLPPNIPNRSIDIVQKSVHTHIASGPPNFQHSLRFSPPLESQFPQQQQQQYHQYNPQQQQHRPSFNSYDQQMNPLMSPREFNQQRSPGEYDLSKHGATDFYGNKSPPFNNRQPEAFMNAGMQRSDAFSSWNNQKEGHDFQGRRLHSEHPRIDPRLIRQHPEVQQPNTRFENTFDNRQCDSNRFFRPDDSNFVDANRFLRPNDNNFDSNRFVRPENSVNQDRNRGFVSHDTNFERQGDNFNRFGRLSDNIDVSRDCNRPFISNDNRFIRSNVNDSNKQGDNRFTRPGDVRDTNRTFKPFEPLDKPESSRFAWTDEKTIPRHDDLKAKSFPKKEEFKPVQPKIEDCGRLDPRLQRNIDQSKQKTEDLKPKAEQRLANSVGPKKEVYDDLYSRINSKVKDEHESFTSPLDSIYDKKEKVTGKGYGIQNFRIPKKPRAPPPVSCPTPPRKRSLSPPLRRPPTPPRKHRSPSPPMERVPTPPPPPNIADNSSDVPELVAQLPESIRKDDRFGDVVTVLSSLLKDEYALTKIKKLLTQETKSDDSSDENEPAEKAVKQRKAKKLIKRQQKKQATTVAKKNIVTKKSPSVSVDSASTDTESSQIRRSSRLRKRVTIFDDDDSEDIEKDNNKSSIQDESPIQQQIDECAAPLTDEQLDEFASCIDPFDDFLPDNEADQLVEEALKQPAEKLEEEINKQLVNDIFDSLKNDDNLDVPAEDTGDIIDSWELAETNANKMIDSWDKNIPDDLFDKDDRDGDSSQDQQQDVRNEIDELIKNMPLNDSDKILDCDIVKANDVIETSVTKEIDTDEISKCDDVISLITKKLTEENSIVEKDAQPICSSDKQPTSGVEVVNDTDIEKLKVDEKETEDTISLKPLQTRPLRSSPRVRPPVSYIDEIKPRAKRGLKKPDDETTSPKKQEPKSSTATSEVDVDKEIVQIESAVKDSDVENKIDKKSRNSDICDSSTSENAVFTNISPEIDVGSTSLPSQAMMHLDLVITELIAKYAVENKGVPSDSIKENTKKVGKKPWSKTKRKVLPIQAEVKVKIEENAEDTTHELLNEESSTEVEEISTKLLRKGPTPELQNITEEIANEVTHVEETITKNGKDLVQDNDRVEIAEDQSKSLKPSVKKSPAKKGRKKSNLAATSKKDTSVTEELVQVEEVTSKEVTEKLAETSENPEVENVSLTENMVSGIDEASELVVKPIETSQSELLTDTGNRKEMDSITEKLTAVESKNDTTEIHHEFVENLSEEVSAIETSPVKQTLKKKRVMSKRRRAFKVHAAKKKMTPKSIAESPSTSDAGTPADLRSIPEEATVAAKVRPRRKYLSELDKLHEDIKETMGDKVLISKRTNAKSPRGAGEIDEPTKTDAKEDSVEESEEEDTESNAKQATKVLQPPLLHQKTKGLKVMVDKMPINKTLSLARKDTLRQAKTAQSAQSEDDSSDYDQDNESSLNDSSFDSLNNANTRKRKGNRGRKASGVRQNKKRKTNSKPIVDATDKLSENDTGDDSDKSDDVDTDYDVEFVEPDAEHYMLKGKATKCRLCDFEGMALVDHYVNNHRAGEVPVSRLPPDDSKLAMQAAIDNNYYADIVPQNLLVKDSKKKKLRFTFTCRFCLQEFPQFSNVQFVDHVATHTGEYRHKCKGCDLKNASARFIKTHYMEEHGNETESTNASVQIIIPAPVNFHTVFGYMCTECHFVQLSYRSVTEHIQIYHLDESATAVKINMSLSPDDAKKLKPTKDTDIRETGVFTSQDAITEEELQREEADRTEMMKEAHKETQVSGISRLSSVAALLKNRFDSSPTTTVEESVLEQQTTQEVMRLPKAKPKEPPQDIKPSLAELQKAAAAAAAITSEVILPKPFSVKYTIFIIGPLKAEVKIAQRTVEFSCITDDCVFYTPSRADMARHCRTAHGSRRERIRCGYCTFVGNAVPLMEVFEHICAKHVDPLLVKDEPLERTLSEVEPDGDAEIAADTPAENPNVTKMATSPLPPRLPFMGNHFGIKIVSVSGGVLDDTVPGNDEAPSTTDDPNELDTSSNAAEVNAATNWSGNTPLPQLLPLSQQSPSVLKKLSNLQKQTTAKLAVVNDGIIVSKVHLNSTQTAHVTTSSPITSSTYTSTSSLSKRVDENNASVVLNPTTGEFSPIDPLLNDDDDVETVEGITDLDVDDPQQVLALLAKVSTLPEDSATATKRRFHTGKTDLLYRCPDSKCGFASGTRKEFDLHLQSIGGGHSDLQRAYRCVYCYTTLPLAQYSAHLVYYHGTSEFGCSRCCYRALVPFQIHLHKNNYHVFDQTSVLLLPLAKDVDKAKVEEAVIQYTASKLRSLIKPFSCYCGKRFIVTANYCAHLEKEHQLEMAKKGVDCRDCQMKGGKNMIAHYAQVHNNHLYQCVYCSFGADTAAADVFTHQSARHPGLQMDVFVRTFAAEGGFAQGRRSATEDETIWSKVVRLSNPQANKDKIVIKNLRENAAKPTVIDSVELQQFEKPPVLLPKQATAPLNLRCTTAQQKAKKSDEIIEIIDLVASSPEPPMEISSIIDDDNEEPTTNASESMDGAKATIPSATAPVAKTSARALSPRCVTPTNQPIISPSVSSNITTPDEDIFVVLQTSSDVPLAGSDLFVCAQCGIHCTTSGVFRAHVHDCVEVDRDTNAKPFGCAHCEKRCKTSTALLDHMRVHGFPRYRCGLCDFKHTQPWNVRSHMKSEHKISTCVQVAAHPNKLDDDFDDFIYRPRQSQLAPPANIPAQPQSAAGKLPAQASAPSAQTSNREPSKDRKLSTSSSFDGDAGAVEAVTPVEVFLPTEVHKLSMRAVYTTEVGCALCGYTSKVRTNIIRHLNLHVDGLAPTDLPTTACVNPVPCLERDELMFDKMTNLAYNSHQVDNKPSTGRMGGPAVKSEPSSGDKNKDEPKAKTTEEGNAAVDAPVYVPSNKRYVCGALDCNYLCHDEVVFRRHIQALHSHSEVSYRCRHCPNETAAPAPAMMNVELVLRHLRLHANTLYRCAHCPFLHNMKSILDRHITERHLDKNVPNAKTIYVVRDLPEETDEDSSLRNSQDSAGLSNVGQGSNVSTIEQTGASKLVAVSVKDAKPWRCAMCKVRCVTIKDIVTHTTSKHKIGTRYKCGFCDYSNDDRDSYLPHFATHHPDSPTPDIITIYFHSPASTTPHTPSSALNVPSTGGLASTALSDKDTNESSDTDQSFDTTPIWRKPTTGDVRHIRGILLETRGQHSQHRRPEAAATTAGKKEGGGMKREHRWTIADAEDGSEEKVEGKRGPAASPAKKQSKLSNPTPGFRISKRTKAAPTSTLPPLPPFPPAQKQQDTTPDSFHAIGLVVSVPVDERIRTHIDSRSKLRLIDVNRLSVSKMLIAGNLEGRFGEYGRPTERGYKCPKCNTFETNGERQFLAHLHKEISYIRYQCVRCNTRTSLAQSVYLRCPAAPASDAPPRSDCVIESRIDADKEQWALMVLAVQTRIAAHLTANGLWALLNKGGLAVDTGAGAALRGLRLAYEVKGTFRPMEIFPKSPATRFSIISKPPISDQPNSNKIASLFQTANQKSSRADKKQPPRNTAAASSLSIEDDLPVSVIRRDIDSSSVDDGEAPKQSQAAAADDDCVFAEVQNITPIGQIAPVLMPKPRPQSAAKHNPNTQQRLGIRMFPQVVSLATDSAERKGAEVIEDDDDVAEYDYDDDDDVEIIDPLVDTVDLDAVTANEAASVKETAGSDKDKNTIAVESVTVSSFLPTAEDDDPLMDDTYSDDDSIALEIAEDDDIDEEVEPLHLQLSPNLPMDTSNSNDQSTSPATTTPTKLPRTSNAEGTTSPPTSLLRLKPVESLTRDQEEQVSSTTSDVPLPATSAGGGGGILATLTPLDASLVSRLRVVGDAAMVGCYGLSAGVGVQVAQAAQTAPADLDVTSGLVTVKGVTRLAQFLKCAHCHFRSCNVQSLKKHELRHWAEKPFRCGFISPLGVPCSFQNHYRTNMLRHIRDVHGTVPEIETPIIHVKITNPTFVELKRQRSNVMIDYEQGITPANASADGSAASIPPSAKRVRVLDGGAGDGAPPGGAEEEFVERHTCPSCTYSSHKARYVQQHLRQHVKCIKCQLCNEKDDQKKRLLEEKCPRHHINIPSRLIIEYDSFELDRLKALIQKIRVPKSSLHTLDQSLTNDDEEDNEFLEVYKTVRNYPTKQMPRKQQQQQQQQQPTIQLLSPQHLTTFDVATSSYKPLQEQLASPMGSVANALYRVDSGAASAPDVVDGATKDSAAPIVLNSLLAQPRISATSSTQQQGAAPKSTGASALSQIPLYAAPLFYTALPKH